MTNYYIDSRYITKHRSKHNSYMQPTFTLNSQKLKQDGTKIRITLHMPTRYYIIMYIKFG